MGKKAALEEIRGKDSRELEYDLREIRKKLFEARFQTLSDTAKTSSICDLRRGIARLKTVLEERKGAEKVSEGTVES